MNPFKSMVGIDASQLYPYSMFRATPAASYRRWDVDRETSRLLPRKSKACSSENLVLTYFQHMTNECQFENCKTSRQKQFDFLGIHGFCSVFIARMSL